MILFEDMKQIVNDSTVFDFWHSPTAEIERGNGSYINVKGELMPYSERIVKDKKPRLIKTYGYKDCKKIFTGNSFQYTLEFKHPKL